MTEQQAMRLALEALEEIHRGNMTPMAEEVWNKAITALRQALEKKEKQRFNPDWDAMAVMVEEQQRMAKRIEELEQQQDEPVAWHTEDHLTDRSATTYKKDVMRSWQDKGWPVTPLYTRPQEFVCSTGLCHYKAKSDERLMEMPEFYHHVVENEGDWSEWVNPDNDSYMMKCCDCGLVHEMQFKVAKYSEGDECEFVNDPDLQPVFRARRAEEAWQEKDMAHRAGGLPQPADWVGLTDEEILEAAGVDGADTWIFETAYVIEAKLREKNGGAA